MDDGQVVSSGVAEVLPRVALASMINVLVSQLLLRPLSPYPAFCVQPVQRKADSCPKRMTSPLPRARFASPSLCIPSRAPTAGPVPRSNHGVAAPSSGEKASAAMAQMNGGAECSSNRSGGGGADSHDSPAVAALEAAKACNWEKHHSMKG